MLVETLKLLIVGAHPDDAEFHAGGLVAAYRAAGHRVKMLSVTDGSAGHQRVFGPTLAAIRRGEADAAAAVVGAESEVWDFPDGRLEPTLELRWQMVAEIRRYRPDLLLTHRTEDYHPDHRAVGHVVRDACYLVTVPALVNKVPALARDPVVGFLPDRFTRPRRLEPDVLVDVTSHFSANVAMLAAHHSQVFDWLPFNRGESGSVPNDAEERLAWLAEWYGARKAELAQRYAAEVTARLPAAPSNVARYVEVFETSEYAAPLDTEARTRLFGFLPSG